jgi:hypothetical protein
MKMTGFIAALLLIAITSVGQQRFFTKNGEIKFYSDAPVEKIEANNRSVSCVLDTKTGQIQFLVLMKGFEFRKALMQEHFNENYVESDKFPKADFKGQVTNNSAVDYTKDGDYPATVKGKLTIHGETRDVETAGTITVAGGKIRLSSVFNILLSDYKISIPATVRDNISKSVQVTVNCSLEPLKTS